MILDQRTNNRVSFFVGGDLYREPDGDKLGRVVIRDISYSGLCIETLEPLEAGQTAYLDFEIAGRFSFRRVPVMVARTTPGAGSYVTGLNFHHGEDRRKIRHALAFTIESSS